MNLVKLEVLLMKTTDNNTGRQKAKVRANLMCLQHMSTLGRGGK